MSDRVVPSRRRGASSLPASAAIERRTRAIGRELFDQIDTRGPSVFNRQWWDDWVMDWSMADEQLKVQMFRFIDVLPMLDSTDAIAEHLQAYFSANEGHFPLLVRLGTNWAEPGTLASRLVGRAIRLNASRLARRFIAGTTPAEVIETVKQLRGERMTFTMDLLGEATVTEREADDYQGQYLDLIAKLALEAATWKEIPQLDRDHKGPLPRVNLSIKATALYSQLDPIDPEGCVRGVLGRLREVLRAARRHGAMINLDMEHYAVKDICLEVFCRILSEPEFRDWPDVGIAIQAYLPDTEHDLRRLLEWTKARGTPVWVRLVKGAYWDYETVVARQCGWPAPVYLEKWQSDAGFERCADFLFDNHAWLRPALASHNLRSMAHALAVAEHVGAPPSSFELQMLYGMGDQLKTVFVERGERLRIYAPFGKLLPGMAYLVRRLLENTSNTSFLRATFTEHTAIDELLRAPAEVGRAHREPAMPPSHEHENLPPFASEPLLDFSRRIHRETFAGALESVRAQFGRSYDAFVGGKPVATKDKIVSVDPADMKTVVGMAAKADAALAAAAVQSANDAFDGWRRTSIWRRVEALLETAEHMRQQRHELAAWEVYEVGKQWREADADVAEAIDFCEYYARSMLEIAYPRKRNIPGEDNAYAYQARGVAVVIAPWNFPLAILAGMTTAPLVAGNTVIIKPAEQSSVIAARFFDILRGLDLPAGVVNFLPGVGEEIGPALVGHPEVSIITFTGSVAVGTAINRLAAETAPGQKHVKRVVAEMGGKNAIIVDDDADMDEAVKGVVASAFGYQGQKCSACSRVIVLPKVYDAFAARLAEAISCLMAGPPADPGNTIGPVIDAEARGRILGAIEQGKREAVCLFAGDVGELAEQGYYVGPHLFAEVKPGSMLDQTELFGPVLALIRARDLDDAINIANGTSYALTGGIFSRNPRSIALAKEHFDVGNLYINRKITGALVDLQPFGGFKLSGVGAKAGGPDYLKQFLTPRTVTENTFRRGFAPSDERPAI